MYQVNLKWYYIDYLIKKKSLNLSTKLDPKSNNESSLFLEKSNRVDCKTAHETKTRSQKSEFCFCLFCHYVSAITIGLGVMNGFTMLFSRKYWHTPTQGFSNSAPFKGQPLENSNSFASGTSSPALFSASKAINLLWKQSPMHGAFFAEIWEKNTFCHFLADIVQRQPHVRASSASPTERWPSLKRSRASEILQATFCLFWRIQMVDNFFVLFTCETVWLRFFQIWPHLGVSLLKNPTHLHQAPWLLQPPSPLRPPICYESKAQCRVHFFLKSRTSS